MEGKRQSWITKINDPPTIIASEKIRNKIGFQKEEKIYCSKPIIKIILNKLYRLKKNNPSCKKETIKS